MASGLSVRYGKDKLREKIGGREVVLHTADHLIEAGLHPLAVTRCRELKALLEGQGVECVLHDGPRKSDTMRVGLEQLPPDAPGMLFMPGDQPLVRPESLKKMLERFERRPERAVRLGFGEIAGSPVIFPAALRKALLAYTGDRGGIEVMKREKAPCDVVQATSPWELWDVDTPEKMEQIRNIFARFLRDRPG